LYRTHLFGLTMHIDHCNSFFFSSSTLDNLEDYKRVLAVTFLFHFNVHELIKELSLKCTMPYKVDHAFIIFS
jgi:hypothetical protein